MLFLITTGSTDAVVNCGCTFLLTAETQVRTTALTDHDCFGSPLGLQPVFGISLELPVLFAMLSMVSTPESDSITQGRCITMVVLFVSLLS